KLLAGELFPGETELYMKAKEEGALIVYTVWDVEHIVKLLAEFSKRYPGISTTYWQAKSAEIVAKVLTALEGGEKVVDVIIGMTPPVQLLGRGAIEPYKSVQIDDLYYKNEKLVVAQVAPAVVAYNKDLLAPEDVPKTLEDLVNPKYMNRVCMGDPLAPGTPMAAFLAGLREYWNNDTKWANFIHRLKALNPVLYRSTSEMERLLAAGEYSLCIGTYLHEVVMDIKKGAPVGYTQIEPTVLIGGYAGIYLLAPHPNAAKLFAEWLVSVEGQLILASLLRTPNRVGVPSEVSLETLLPNVHLFIPEPEAYLADMTKYMETQIKPVWES
ncbi:MAG: extracellular solute-binding protein, partial [Candidatus Bathyarchaeia archaeon]